MVGLRGGVALSAEWNRVMVALRDGVGLSAKSE